ncbi:MAG: alpha/beta fold hydrolase [Betaproteobacteria bacterium]|jgi:pimeloyl-ACP methyl ester carboxylesterase|nr:alpha/beta fold hydrolase [Betaproteobacteria bacterium]
MSSARESVVLLHGLWMNRFVMGWLAHRLASRGYAVHLFGYPSFARMLDANAESLARFLRTLPAQTLHLVGHSLGGVTAIASLAARPDPRVRRVVLLGSPVRGSAAGVQLAAHRIGRQLLGRSVGTWGITPVDKVPAGIEVGVIAGTRRLGIGAVFTRLSGPNDGVVTVAETALPGARDSVVLHVAHSQMLVSPAVARQTEHFLRTGRFIR